MPPSPSGLPLPPNLPSSAPDIALEDFYDYLKVVHANEGMGAITKTDIEQFYALMQNPNQYTITNLENIFGLLEQFASAEAFEDPEIARECVQQIGFYREELGL
jgi:hypothetical protein